VKELLRIGAITKSTSHFKAPTVVMEPKG